MRGAGSWTLLALVGILATACSDGPASNPADLQPQLGTVGTPNKQDWKQCQNDSDYSSPCSWTTGNLNQTHNTYSEGDFVPKVLRVPGIQNAAPFEIVMTYGFLKGGKTTHDFLGEWNDDMVNANPCTDGSFTGFCTGGVNGLNGTLNAYTATSNLMDQLSLDAVEEACGAGQYVTDMAEAIAAEGAGKLVIRGINVSSIAVTNISFDGCPATGDAEAFLTMTVTPNALGASSGNMLLLFGAHVAESSIWDNGGAAGVSGSPYHLGLVRVDGKSSGSMDLQMAAAAIVQLDPSAAITIGPDGTNEIGDSHVITGTVTTQADAGEPFLPAPDGTQIDFVIESGPGSLTASSCTTAGGTGSCTVELMSGVTGVTVVSATATVSVSGFNLVVATDGTAPNSDNLQKTWVDAKIAISPLTDLNPLGEAHTFTVTLMKDLGDGAGFVAAAGETVTASQAGTLAPVTLGGTCTGGGTTNASGQCTFTYTSNIAGTLILTASSTLSVGGVSLTRSTNGIAPNSGPATKTWGGAWITIGADATNEVGDAHTFTVTVMRQVGAGAPEAVSGLTVTPTGDTGDITGGTCTAGGTTNASGQCTIIVNSATAGQASIGASANVPLNGTSIAVSTNGVGQNSGPAVKTWVDAKIAISPLTDLNPLGEAHTFTVTLMKDLGDGNGFVAAAGETVTASQAGTLAPVTLGGTCTGGGTTNASGQCTFTYTSLIPGTLILTASSTLSVDGESLTRSTDGTGNNSGPATKTWGGAWITIGADATNEVGDAHTFTVTVMRQVGGGAAEPVDGVGVTPTGDTGDITGGTCTGGGTTDASGQCTIIVNSATAGQASIGASANVPLNGTSIAVSTDGVSPNSGPAVKTWVDAKIAISPLTDLNPLGEAHTFTVTLMKDLGDGAGFVAAAGETVTATQSGSLADVTLGGTCTGGGTTNASGQCTFTYTSNIAGTLILTASSTLSVDGVSLTRSTDGNAPNSGPATKTWGGAWITIGADGTNEVGAAHTFTVTVMRQVGAGAPEAVSGVTVTPTGDTGNITGGTCTGGGTTNASGQCTIIVNSATAGQASIGASANVPLNGTSIAVSTDGVSPNSGPATKTWVDAKIEIAASATNMVGEPHTFTVTVWEDAGDGAGFVVAAGETVTVTETGVGDLTGGSCTDTSLDAPGDPQSGSGPTDGSGQCTAIVNSAVAGSSTVTASANVSVGGIVVAVSTDGNAPNSAPATKTWLSPGATLLIIDEDGIDNGLHFNANGGPITPDGPNFFSAWDVNDDMPGEKQRSVLRYFQNNVGRTITVRTGQTGDEAWFAPNCIPQKWISSSSNTCLEGANRQTAISNYFGLNGSSAIPSQSRLDKIPAVMPLRALGLNSLIDRDICAVVYDSDISINYNSSRFPFTDGNLQGETLGIVAFRVNEVRTLNGFSSSTLPEVQITILSASTCGTFELFNAPVPSSSSVPNDRVAPGSPSGYRSLLTRSGLGLFY